MGEYCESRAAGNVRAFGSGAWGPEKATLGK